MPFTLSCDQLMDVARQMRDDLRAGLAADSADLLCIPSFVPRIWPPASGRVLAIDMGGTNARCAVVSLDNSCRFTVESGPVRKKISIKRNVPRNRDFFLDFLTGLIRQVDPPRGLPTGFCFAYPSRPTPDGDAEILGWTKELFVEDTVGEKVGGMLVEYLKTEDPGLIAEGVLVINDTIATLLAGMASTRAEIQIGLVVGTGTNMAILLPPERVPKIKGDVPLKSVIPVNLESGNFHPPHLNAHDEALDASSSNPSRHRFEKAVSGMYLPYLFKQVCPESHLDAAGGSGPLFTMAYSAADRNKENSTAAEALIARRIVERSASLIAAALAGVITFLSETLSKPSVCVTAEGGLFYAHPRYKEVVASTLGNLLQGLGQGHATVEISALSNANFLGCAIAGLTSVTARRSS